MKESISKSKNIKKTAMIFRCGRCGNSFISNEWGIKFTLAIVGSELWKRHVYDACPVCKTEVCGARTFRPVLGSEEYKKWCE